MNFVATVHRLTSLRGAKRRSNPSSSRRKMDLKAVGLRFSKRSPDERSDIRGSSPAYRCAHAGYPLSAFSWCSADDEKMVRGSSVLWELAREYA